MEIKQVMALVNAGYTKADIEALTHNVQSIQNMTPNVQPIQNMTPNVQPIQNMTPNVQPIQNMTPNVQPIQNIDYKTLYETQKKMLEDMQTLNLTGTKGAPIDSPLSVVNDFLGGEK